MTLLTKEPTSSFRPFLDSPLIVQFDPIIQMDDEQFFEFCQINRELRIERSKTGEVIIMSPAGGETGSRNANLTMQVGFWANRDRTGVAFDSSTGFILPNGATRSPDAAWVRHTRLAMLTSQQKQKFLPLCPDFVVELASPSDALKLLQAKMEEYIANGAVLGWLLLPDSQTVYIYRPNSAVERLEKPSLLHANPELLDFTLDLTDIWNPGF